MSKVILITGASGGIGAALAKGLARNNTIIVHYCSNEESGQNVAKEVESLGGKAILIGSDLSSNSGCENLYERVAGEVERLDVLINNAGAVIKRQMAADIHWSHLMEMFELNTFSVMRLTALCLPLLESGITPCVINVTSLAVRLGAPTATAYAASKGAIDSYTRGLAKELAPRIRVNAIAPGLIQTKIHESSPERLEKWRKTTPLHINGEASDVTGIAELLINNRFMTGETIDINGGLHMR